MNEENLKQQICDFEQKQNQNTKSIKTENSDQLIDSWRDIQGNLGKEVIDHDTEAWENDFKKLRYVAGLDISTPKDQPDAMQAFTAIAIFSFPELKLVHQEVQAVTLDTPYIPGFLAFREAPAVCQLVQKVLDERPELTPDVLLIDGNGLLHPQRCGLACHIGLKMDLSTVGVAKNLFHMPGLDIPDKEQLQGLKNTGDFLELKSTTSEALGMALKTSDLCKNPVYVSIGHKISLETARRVVVAVSKFRVPEPIRVADHISREAIAAAQKSAIRSPATLP